MPPKPQITLPINKVNKASNARAARQAEARARIKQKKQAFHKEHFSDETEAKRGFKAGKQAAYYGSEKKDNLKKSAAFREAYTQAYDEEWEKLSPEQKDVHRGRNTGYAAAYIGSEKKKDLNGESRAFQEAYHSAYDKERAKLTTEQTDVNRGKHAGYQDAFRGCKKKEDLSEESVAFQQAYHSAYDKKWEKLRDNANQDEPNQQTSSYPFENQNKATGWMYVFFGSKIYPAEENNEKSFQPSAQQ